MNNKDHTNNNGETGPVIITAECRLDKGGSMQYYNPICGKIVNDKFYVTIHNYESEALGKDPVVKSEKVYYHYLYLSTMMDMPWGISIKFRDNNGVIFGLKDIVGLLEDRTPEIMKKWEVKQKEFEMAQRATADKLEVDDSDIGDIDNNNDNNDGVMTI